MNWKTCEFLEADNPKAKPVPEVTTCMKVIHYVSTNDKHIVYSVLHQCHRIPEKAVYTQLFY